MLGSLIETWYNFENINEEPYRVRYGEYKILWYKYIKVIYKEHIKQTDFTIVVKSEDGKEAIARYIYTFEDFVVAWHKDKWIISQYKKYI